MLDGHGDHILGCGDGPLRIRQHDAICDLKLLWHALVQDQRKNSVVVVSWTVPGMSFIQTFSLACQPTLMFLCITLCRILYFVICCYYWGGCRAWRG